MPYGTIRIRNAVFYAHHGVKKEEHRIGGRYEVDVAMEVDFEAAASKDDLSKTVDYEKIYKLVRDIVTSNNFYLIERLVYLIARNILKSNAIIREVEVSVRKANPPVGGPCDYAEATYRYKRSKMKP